MKIRPFAATEADYASIAKIHNAIWPENLTTVRHLRYRNENRDPKYIYNRYISDINGSAVGYGLFWQLPWSALPGKFEIEIAVHPDNQRKGIGNAIYDFLRREMVAYAPTRLTTGTREDRHDARRFLENRGFEEVMRYPISRLEATDFRPGRYRDKLEKVADSGIVISTLAELMGADEEWKQKIYELEQTIAEDVPMPDEHTKISIEEYERQLLKHPAFTPEAWFVALDGDAYVGMSTLWRDLANDRRLGTGLTGVLRKYRRRGIATALKTNAILFAQSLGNVYLETGNEENNPMFQLNLELGFKPQPAWLDYVLKLNGQPAGRDDEKPTA